MSTIPSLNASPGRPFPAAASIERHHRHHDASASASICSDDSSDRSTTTKSSKKVRFDEFASWSYFDADASQPVLRRYESNISLGSREARCDHHDDSPRPSLPRRSSSLLLKDGWQKFKRHGVSSDLDTMWSRLRGRNPSIDSNDSLSLGKPSAGTVVRHPLRESSGRRYDMAQTAYDPAISTAWRASPPALVKGDWNDLLGLQ